MIFQQSWLLLPFEVHLEINNNHQTSKEYVPEDSLISHDYFKMNKDIRIDDGIQFKVNMTYRHEYVTY